MRVAILVTSFCLVGLSLAIATSAAQEPVVEVYKSPT